MNIIKYRKIFYWFSGIIIVFSIFAVSFWGLKFGIDFTGGSILEFRTENSRIDKKEIETVVKGTDLDLGDFSLRESGELGYILRTKNITFEQKDELLQKINSINELSVVETRFSDIGPTLGKELGGQAIWAIILVSLLIVLYVAFVFRKVSKPISSWNYGLVTIVTFLHDVIVPIGLFAVLGQFAGFEVDTLFVVAILVVLGYSINDTIVVFDRVRENLLELDEKQKSVNFEKIVGKSVEDTISRSINTSLTTLLALFAIFFIGGEVTKAFSLAMIAGVLTGAYSSIFIASPLLFSIKKYKDKNLLKASKQS
jgi:preprotein translocase subunit SecF